VDDMIGHEFPGNAEPRADDTAMRAQFIHHSLGGINGDRKADVLATSQNRHIDADDLGFLVNKRPTAVSRVNGSTGLYHSLVGSGLRVRCCSKPADNPCSERVAQSERVTDGHHFLRDIHTIRGSQMDYGVMSISVMCYELGQVLVRILSHQFSWSQHVIIENGTLLVSVHHGLVVYE